MALYESCVNTLQPQLGIYGRYIRGNEIAEELLKLMTLDKTTKGVDIYEIVSNFFNENDIDLDKVVQCDVDGAPAMVGNIMVFKGLLHADHAHVIVNHSIIHRQALAAKDLSVEFGRVVTVINFIKARDLNSRVFRKLCADNDADHTNLLF